jgi:hypothetical protein
MPTSPTPIQNTFNRMYAGSFFMTADQESTTASQVLNAQTKKKGLLGPSQLTSEKLNIRINTPVISIMRRFRRTTPFNLPIVVIMFFDSLLLYCWIGPIASDEP